MSALLVKHILPRRRCATVTASAGCRVQDASRRMATENIGSLIVIDTCGRPIGVLSERDIARACADRGEGLTRSPVSQIMTSKIVTCNPEETIQTVKARMTANNFRHLPVEDKGVIVGMISMRDIINHQVAALDARNQLLEETEQQFRQAVEESPNGIYVQVSGVIIYANQAMALLVGAAVTSNLTDRHSIDLFHPDYRDEIRERRDNIEHNGTKTNAYIDVTFMRLDGSSFDAEITSHAVLWDGKQGIMVTVRDVTSRKKTEAALRTAKEEAELSDRSKSEFLANMSHELRTPLNAIIGFSQVLAQGTPNSSRNGEYRDYIQHINNAGQHLLSLINDVVDTARIDSGNVSLQEEQVDIPDIINASKVLIAERAKSTGIKLRTEISEHAIPPLYADPRRLKQILINLLSNAVKFTEAGGTVTIKAWYTADSGYVIQCIDTGIGISMTETSKAMGRFQQVDSALNRKHEGTGLGLPLSKSFVELHGGSMDLQSVPGKGTTVTVRLPAERRIKSAA